MFIASRREKDENDKASQQKRLNQGDNGVRNLSLSEVMFFSYDISPNFMLP